MIRNVIAVVVGMIAGMAANMAVVFINVAIYPMPEGVSFSDTEGMKEYIGTLPVAALLIVIVAHVGQAFVGGWVAARISANKVMVVAMFVGVLSLIGGALNMMDMPLPTWMWVEMPLYLLAAWFAASIELKRRSSSA